jgi:hypothetical protein
MLTPISNDTCPPPVTTSPSLWASYCHTTYQPRGSHQADVSRVAKSLVTRKLVTSTVEIDSPQPPRPRYAIWRGGPDSMVAPTSRYSGLRDSEGFIFHLQTHESMIRDVSRHQIPGLSFLFDQRPRSHCDLTTRDFMTPRA